MRIISGEFKGRKLNPIKGVSIRPTSDSLRESMFSIIGDRINGANVLDLFAGTGAIGIESLSRGALSVVMIDNALQALSVIRKNVDHCNASSNVRILRWDIVRNLNCLKNLSFDMIIMDPPYEQGFILPTFDNLVKVQCFTQNSLIVVEHSIRDILPTEIAKCFELADQRKYGKAFLSFFLLKA